ncbi:hypothetical protein [Sinisalibacter lacisalsi]|nr:hypothetical protein [Sinisalibacter lacisalsi]
MKKTFVLAGLVSLLVGCQAEELEVSISSEQMISAASGESEYVEFEAEIGESMSDVDDEKRATIKAIEIVLGKYFPDADIETKISSDSYRIEIEGELALSSSIPRSGAPWFVEVMPQGGNNHLVRLMPSGTFSAFKSEMADINFMITPDEFQGVDFSIRGSIGTVTFGGAYLNGEPRAFSVLELDGERHRVSFKEGIWTKTGAGFLFSSE